MSFSSLLYASIALGLAGIGLFQFREVANRKLALLLLMLASAGVTTALTESWWLGAFTLLLWVAFPASELFFVLSRLRVPKNRALNSSHAPVEEFPELRDLTQKIEDLGFRKVDDCKLVPALHDQFYRLFVHPTEPIYSFIGFVWQGAFGFHFIAFGSEDRSGDQWVTWDYPLSYGLMVPPTVMLYRVLYTEEPAELLEAHRAFLEENSLRNHDLVATPDALSVRAQLERTLSTQLAYNVSNGILSPAGQAPENFRYSWRGACYVVTQVLRDLVKL
jgi:hypothetical protein